VCCFPRDLRAHQHPADAAPLCPSLRGSYELPSDTLAPACLGYHQPSDFGGLSRLEVNDHANVDPPDHIPSLARDYDSLAFTRQTLDTLSHYGRIDWIAELST
jgi:hypothetical protein